MRSKWAIISVLMVSSAPLLVRSLSRGHLSYSTTLLRTANPLFASASTLSMAAPGALETSPYCAAFVTAPSMDVAKKIASGLVSNKLAACVNIIPGVTSVYEWEGKIEEDSELILMIKSRCSRTEELTEYVKKNHPYDVCEVITTPILGGNPDYLKWLGDLVQEKK